VTGRGASRHVLGLVLLILGITACGDASPTGEAAGGAEGDPGTPPAASSPAGAAATGWTPTGGVLPAASGVPRTWSLTVYYTAVESYHGGPLQTVTGCPLGGGDCSDGATPLGSYPGDFLQAVRDEGAGRITTGPDAGRYLIWDPDHGWSVDTAPRDAAGDPLRPFVSAATDVGIALGIDFRVLDCGVDRESGDAIDPVVCRRLTAARWEVDDRDGEPSGSHDLVLYVGEEDQPDFDTSSPLMIDTVGARSTLR
jgi:hypothetical protein